MSNRVVGSVNAPRGGEVYISDNRHCYAVQLSEQQADNLGNCDPLYAFVYKQPDESNERDVDACREIDEKNQEIYEHNQRVVQLINPILTALFHRPIVAHPPAASYASEARKKYKEWLEDPTVRLRESIRFLVKRGIFDPNTDLDQGATKADAVAEQEEKERLIHKWNGQIPIGHGANRAFWDGHSDRDSNQNRARWHCTPYHSFLKPHVIPENW